MNLQKITEFFPWDTSSRLESQCILCLDQSALVNTSHSGEFLFTALLLKLLHNANLASSSSSSSSASGKVVVGGSNALTKVVLVLSNHNRQHYESIVKKNYLDLKLLEKNDNIVIINLYSDENQKQEATTGCPWKVQTIASTAGTEKHWTWSEFKQWQEEKAMTWSSLSSSPSESTSSSSSSYILMIDDLEAFEILAESIPAARQFLSNALSLIDNESTTEEGVREEGEGGKINGLICFGRHPVETKMQLPTMTEFFVVAAHNEINGNNGSSSALSSSHLAHTPLHGNGQPKLTEYMRYRADITLVASPLMTGHSSAIHGTIAVQQSNSNKKCLLQYKALDSGIMCSPRGDGW